MQLLSKRRSIMGLCMALLLSCVALGQTVNCEAAEQIDKSIEKTFLFTVPEGGCSTCRVHIDYTEFYNTNHGKNTFNKRVKWYTGSCAYVTEKPDLIVGNVVHKNSSGDIIHTFSKWEFEDGLFPGGMTYCGTYKNTGSVTYAKNTGNKGMLAYIVSCRGANIPTHAERVTMRLATK